jgi:outer membrane protein OmpA-like peptidoglycan-associated protein
MRKLIFPTAILCLFSIAINAQNSFIKNDHETSTASFEESKDIYTIEPTGINTKQSDIGTAIFKNKYIMYSSRKTGAIGAGRDVNTDLPYNTLYCIDIDKSTGKLSKAYFFANNLDSKGNEGGLTFSKDQKKIYYTKSTDTNSKNYQMYQSIFDEKCKCKWIEEKPVSFNNESYSIENPSISADGNKIYFSSNMPGGFGGYDIYVADINAEGMPVNPINLGKSINTAGDEKFPNASNSDKEFYFASSGHSGYGALDVFVSRTKKVGFGKPLNLGKTINSSYDDIAYTVASSTSGYVTSNRAEGLGNFDIYKFDVQKSNAIIKGKAVEKQSKIALPNTTVLLINQDGEEVASQNTSDNGAYVFEINPLESYSIQAKKDGYLDFANSVSSSNESNIFNIELDQKQAEIVEANNIKMISIENIYFDYNKATIKKESTLSLNKILSVLSENPDMRIAINAHTDNRGSDKYNLNLSDKRAFEAKQYLIKKGIKKDRIESKGFGKSESISKCDKNCTEEQYNADRRVEFVIK